jgi:hypothetical protein
LLGEHHRPRPQPLGQRVGRAVREFPVGCRAGGDDDACRCSLERIQVGLVMGAGDDVLADDRIVAPAVVLGREPEHLRVRRRSLEVVRRDGAVVHDDRDELRHRRPHAGPLVRLVDVATHRECGLAVGQDRREGRLVRDDRPEVLGMARHERERVHRAAAAREQVHRTEAEILDDPVEVVGVFLRGRPAHRVVLRAPLDAPRVVRDHGPVREVTGERAEAARAHRGRDEEQRRRVCRPSGAHVVGQCRARHLERAGRRLGHGHGALQRQLWSMQV